jgi:hypothetical protein
MDQKIQNTLFMVIEGIFFPKINYVMEKNCVMSSVTCSHNLMLFQWFKACNGVDMKQWCIQFWLENF